MNDHVINVETVMMKPKVISTTSKVSKTNQKNLMTTDNNVTANAKGKC